MLYVIEKYGYIKTPCEVSTFAETSHGVAYILSAGSTQLVEQVLLFFG